MKNNLSLCQPLVMIAVACLLASCGSSGSSSSNCDVVANAAGPAFFRVENKLNTGLSWFLPAFAFGADMKPDECTIFGLPAAQYTVELQQCNIGGGACTSSFGPVVMKLFTVEDGETYKLKVKSSTF